jgi:protein ImuB
MNMFACLYRPPAPDDGTSALEAIAQEFSPRFERYPPDLVAIDIRGLERLIGPPRAIAHEMRREAAHRGLRVHVAIARTQVAAVLLALAHPGITLVERGDEAAALAPVAIDILGSPGSQGLLGSQGSGGSNPVNLVNPVSLISTLKQWGLKRLGELAALPSADLAARLGQQGLAWQAIARGEDIHPLVPTLPDERFEAALELEWPIEGLDPLSFVLTRLLEPLSTRLERRDRGAAVLHIRLRLVTRAVHARSLELPAPLRDVRTLRTLALVDLESHPPPAAIDAVTVVIDPTPGRVLQHALFARAHPTPDQISTLLARLGALMGQDRIGAPSTLDTDRPGAFEMNPFAVQEHQRGRGDSEDRAPRVPAAGGDAAPNGLVSALRRFRQPVAARVTMVDGRPVRVTTDRRGFTGGAVVACAGPWRTSGDWWAHPINRSHLPDRHFFTGAGAPPPARSDADASAWPRALPWDRDEWDVALSDDAVYRVFCDRETGRWFIEAVVD